MKQLFRAVSLIVAGFGALLLVETGRLAVALGAAVGPAMGVSSDVGFWYQLSFMRLFGAALLGVAGLCLWAASQLGASQQRSLGLILGGVFGLLAFVAVAQQVAIWDSITGWAVAGVLGLIAAMLGASAMTTASRQAV